MKLTLLNMLACGEKFNQIKGASTFLEISNKKKES